VRTLPGGLTLSLMLVIDNFNCHIQD